MSFFVGLLLETAIILCEFIWPCRIISMVFNTFSRSITIRNDKLAEMFIAENNSWGISTDLRKRNKMSLWGVFGYMLFLPMIVLIPYSWWFCMETESLKWSDGVLNYCCLALVYYIIALLKNISEANKFRKGEIW